MYGIKGFKVAPDYHYLTKETSLQSQKVFDWSVLEVGSTPSASWYKTFPVFIPIQIIKRCLHQFLTEDFYDESKDPVFQQLRS